ncbi:DUF6328 family protein [Nocardioides marmotae]|uniref:Sodium:proton antiporter n=1 Tax=Nocardioides marmotae TaxID=2663857 RepID=A0A6I3IX08_9ACTN|nr:DUF6328 family protein [Nocardioides marmotae]MCR6031275.1 sodium:proton antiporter [Gordonia jinghuaiqii]MBC9733707.1 sodium:proton antiporter [Nocardioides marmotae]MTB84810.1 sodium:proton antiporter [Nocardioides marmotae]MTB94913.1 sodium:proton antiporter [Nocardioides marmotae]QKE02575.1 sodium:proton antiporter [Nocardioides marmotae]
MERGRNETEEERLDRLWADLLQELRVMQTGTQLLAGFLLTLPFQEVFWERLERYQHAVYLVLVVTALVTTLLVTTPIAIHRRLSGQHVKERLVGRAQQTLRAVLACIGGMVALLSFFVFDVVVGPVAGGVAAASLGTLAAVLLVLVPRRLAR